MMGLTYAWNDPMKDAFERRALLLHLGDVLNAMDAVLKRAGNGRSVQQLVQTEATLAAVPLLAQIADRIEPHEFVQRASAAFARWPSALLEEELNHEQIAATVYGNLFIGNAAGWHAYVAVLKPEVPWFGDGVSPKSFTDMPTVAELEEGAAPAGQSAVEQHAAGQPAAVAEQQAAEPERSAGEREPAATTDKQLAAEPSTATTGKQPAAEPSTAIAGKQPAAAPSATKEHGDRFYPAWPWKSRA